MLFLDFLFLSVSLFLYIYIYIGTRKDVAKNGMLLNFEF